MDNSPARLKPQSLVPLLRADAVPMAVLHERYGALLKLVRVLIGVVPNCDPFLEIWPAAFRTYNIMVPNFLNLPFSIFGFGGPKAEVVGLGMYVASRAAECPYCSAHCCSFSLRRGASAEKMAQALVPRDGAFNAEELATIAVARSLARIPCELIDSERAALQARFSAADAEWVVTGIAMMGFLNKFMDAIGVELETPTLAETSKLLGSDWSPGKSRDESKVEPTAPPSRDSFWTKLQMVPFMPAALRLDKKWQRGVPDKWPAVGEFLREKTGHDFPLLSRIHNRRVIRSIASMLRENIDASNSELGIPTKILAGVIFASVISDKALANEVRAVAAKFGVADAEMDSAANFAQGKERESTAKDPRARAALLLARAASPSPAQIDAEVVEACSRGGLSPAGVIELVTWIAVLQMLHRLSCYYPASA